jgi:hypothetical protein
MHQFNCYVLFENDVTELMVSMFRILVTTGLRRCHLSRHINNGLLPQNGVTSLVLFSSHLHILCFDTVYIIRFIKAQLNIQEKLQVFCIMQIKHKDYECN